MMEWWVIIWVDVICKFTAIKNINKNVIILVMLNGQTTDATNGFEILSDTVLLLKVHRFEAFSNQHEIDRMVSNHLSRCSLHQFIRFPYNNFEPQTKYIASYYKISIKLAKFYLYVTRTIF